MLNKYFSVDLVPDIVDGDVSDVYGGDGVNLAPNDLIADWVEVDVPKGVNLLRSISMVVNNSDGGATVAGVIQSDKTDLAFAVNDLVFDWTAVDVPSGSKVLKSASMYIAGKFGPI